MILQSKWYEMPFKKGVVNFLVKLSIEVNSLINLGRTFHNLAEPWT